MKRKTMLALLSTVALSGAAALVVMTSPHVLDWPDWLAMLPLVH